MTAAQHRAISEITADQAAPKRMLRMLQGDVGSGKTLVALAAMLSVVEVWRTGSAFGANRSIGAAASCQLERSVAALADRRLACCWVRGAPARKNRTPASKIRLNRRQHSAAAKPLWQPWPMARCHWSWGTHALLSDTAIFKDLGVAVIDEQHRFGVRQRILLGEKGRNVDVMVMTATPIPRSLAMTAYGDLDHSQLDEKPVGRLPIDTRVIAGERLDDIVDGLRRALGDGKRAYWICPLVDESDQLDIAAAEDRFASLSHALPGISVALAHGKMKAAERDKAMQDFRTGRAQLLVATTVVEVGVDVPEASIIVIEHA
jgi:ATP-dependent DNA helicase RecG